MGPFLVSRNVATLAMKGVIQNYSISSSWKEIVQLATTQIQTSAELLYSSKFSQHNIFCKFRDQPRDHKNFIYKIGGH